MNMITKIKPLSPSLRQKKRYLVFEVISEKQIDFNVVNNIILQNSSNFLGELGMAEAGIFLLQDKFDTEKKKGIIKVNHKYVHHLKSALALINDEDAIFRSVGVSGILNKAEKKFIAG